MAYIGKQPKANVWGFTPQSTIPANPREGDVYNDDGTNQTIAGLYIYQGTTWNLLRTVASVDTADLVDGAVTKNKIADGAVTKDKIADGAVTPAKLSTGHPDWDSSSNFKMNSGYGSNEVAYGCRAWVNFKGTGTVAINASGNVSSITDNGSGDYDVNFTTSMPDKNYTIIGGGYNAVDTRQAIVVGLRISDSTGLSTTFCRLQTLGIGASSTSISDCEVITALFVR